MDPPTSTSSNHCDAHHHHQQHRSEEISSSKLSLALSTEGNASAFNSIIARPHATFQYEAQRNRASSNTARSLDLQSNDSLPYTLVLITSCMQNDFFHRFPKRRYSSMNRYWVGRKESERVLGYQPRRGPFAQLMNWVRGTTREESITDEPDDTICYDGNDVGEEERNSASGTPLLSVQSSPVGSSDTSTGSHAVESRTTNSIDSLNSTVSSHRLYVIHRKCVLDKLNPDDRKVLGLYGEYCLSETEGSKLCLGLEDQMHLYPNESLLTTNRELDKNSFRPLKHRLRDIELVTRKPLRVAVIGGWTDEDIYHICYELRTHTAIVDIATCSVLTASPAASQHWWSLSQMQRIMNVTVTRTVRELIDWFGLCQSLPIIEAFPTTHRPEVFWSDSHTPLATRFETHIDGEILTYLYRNSSRMFVTVLSGGMSPAIVLSVQSYDRENIREAPSVVKLSNREAIAVEYQAFQRVEEMLGNNAPAIRGFVELGNRAGIKFRYTRMSEGNVRKLVDYFDMLPSQEARSCIKYVIDEIYGEIFSAWYAGAHSEMFDLFSYYFDGYSVSKDEFTSYVHQNPYYLKQFISYCLQRRGTDPAPHYKTDPTFYSYEPYTEALVTFPLCIPISNIGTLFEKSSGIPYLRTLLPRRYYASFAHGDTNLQNILIDARHNVWVIDYFYTTPGNHVLRDLAKTFTCIMCMGACITTDLQFSQAFLVSVEIARARDLNVPLPENIPGVTDDHILFVYSLLRQLWSHAGRLVRERSNAVQFQLAIVADFMRAFLYSCRNMYSKRWALVTSVLCSEAVLIQEKRVHDITPSWISLTNIPGMKGRIGITRCPGNKHFLRYEKVEDRFPISKVFSESSLVSLYASYPSSVNATPKGPDAWFKQYLSEHKSRQEQCAELEEQQRLAVKSKWQTLPSVKPSSFLTNSLTTSIPENQLLDKFPPPSIPIVDTSLDPKSPSSNSVTLSQIAANATDLGQSKEEIVFSQFANLKASSPARRTKSEFRRPSGDKFFPPPGFSGFSHGISKSKSSEFSIPTSRLEREIWRLYKEGVTHLLLLLTDDEYSEMGVNKVALFTYARELGLLLCEAPVSTGLLPASLLIRVVDLCLPLLTANANCSLVIISKGGFHRAGTAAACLICACDSSPDRSIRLVRDARGPQAIGSNGREKVIGKFYSAWKIHQATTTQSSSQSSGSGNPSSTNYCSNSPQAEKPLDFQ